MKKGEWSCEPRLKYKSYDKVTGKQIFNNIPKDTQMKKKTCSCGKTSIVCVLDRSGSMASVKSDTEGGFNTFLEDQKKQPGEADITLVQFDNIYEVVYSGVDIKNAPNLILNPRGSTALYDALGKAINETNDRLSKLCECCKPQKVIVVIMTDGGENASREYTKYGINQMITHYKECHNWQFVFIGANQDAFEEGRKIGIQGGCVLSYNSNEIGVKAMYKSLSDKMSSVRSLSPGEYTMSVQNNQFFDDNDRNEQVKASNIKS